MPRSRALLAVGALILVCVAVAPSARADDPVNLRYYVTDNVGVIDYSDVGRIEDLIMQVETDTSAQFAVYVVNNTGSLSLEEFAVRTFELSQLGQKGVDNGLLIVVSISDHRYKVEVGYGLEGVLNDAKVGEVGRAYLVPAFRTGDYGKGIYDAVEAFGVEVASSDLEQPSQYPIPGVPLNWWQIVVAAVVFIVLLVLTRGRIFFWLGGATGRGGGGKSGGGGAGGGW